MHCKPSDEFPPIIMQGQTDEQARHTMPHAVAQTHSELMENMNSMLRKEPLPQLPPDEPEPVDTINHVPFQPVGSCQGRYTAIKPMLPRKIDDEEVMDTNPDRNGNVSGKLSSNPDDPPVQDGWLKSQTVGTSAKSQTLPTNPQARKAIVTRREAILAGKKWYFTGKPCVRGHIDERHVNRRTCRSCAREKDRERHAKQPRREYARRNSWRRKGMPEPTRPRPDLCEMCGQPPTKRALHLDHDHQNGEFRGWLCHYCNTSLGRFGDQIEGLVRAAQYLGWSEANRYRCRLPDDAGQRKNIPLWDGLFAYFPDALMAVAALSKIGNDQHNPGQPLRWDRSKSPDHENCLLRHLMQRGTFDTDGVRHTAKVAWRALAILQLELEAAAMEHT